MLVYLYVRHPERLPLMRRVFLGEDLPAAGPVREDTPVSEEA